LKFFRKYPKMIFAGFPAPAASKNNVRKRSITLRSRRENVPQPPLKHSESIPRPSRNLFFIDTPPAFYYTFNG
ncbi:MAG: hypothetical protein J6T65_10480, partial [Clostridia bacterium]|nr:hypothetical protein [Clostridia bacterium]